MQNARKYQYNARKNMANNGLVNETGEKSSESLGCKYKIGYPSYKWISI